MQSDLKAVTLKSSLFILVFYYILLRFYISAKICFSTVHVFLLNYGLSKFSMHHCRRRKICRGPQRLLLGMTTGSPAVL